MKFRQTSALFLFISWTSFASAQHREPGPPDVVIDSYQTLNDDQFQARIDYSGISLTMKGVAIFDALDDSVTLHLEYESTQDLAEGARLSFQTYDKDKQLLKRDHQRADFRQNGEGLHAVFDAKLSLRELGLDSRSSDIYLQFNYVNEGEYWYDMKFPDIELPSIYFTSFPRGECFDPIFSFHPIVAPRSTRVYSPLIFSAYNSKEGVFKHRNAIQAEIETPKLQSPRRSISDSLSLGFNRYATLTAFRSLETGKFRLRQGLVWDYVQWYELYPNNDYKDIYIVSNLAYCGLAGFTAFVVWTFWRAAGKTSNPYSRKIAKGLSGFGAALLIAHLASSSYILTFAILVILAWIQNTKLNWPVRLYSTAFLTLFAIECYWLIPAGDGRWYVDQLAISFFLYAIVLSPLALVSRKSFGLTILAFLTLIGCSYFPALTYYSDFFNDLPSLRTLGYMSQITQLTGSISSIADDHWLNPIAFCAWSWSCLLIRENRYRSTAASTSN